MLYTSTPPRWRPPVWLQPPGWVLMGWALVSRDSASPALHQDRKSTRLNSSHTVISYAVFCLKKKKTSRNSDLLQTNINNTHSNIAYHMIVLVNISLKLYHKLSIDTNEVVLYHVYYTIHNTY